MLWENFLEVTYFNAVSCWWLQSQFSESHGNVRRSSISSSVYKCNCVRIVGLVDWCDWSRPDFDPFVLVNSSTLNAYKSRKAIVNIFFIRVLNLSITKWILVNSNNFSVLKNCFVLGSNWAKIDWHQQRCGKDRPQCHLGLWLFVAEPKVSNN